MTSPSPVTRAGPSLMERSHEPEWMDEPDLDPALHQQALAGLARLNLVGRSAAMLWHALRPYQGAPLRVLDLACGGGDVLVSLARRAAARGYAWEFLGVDKSPTALRLAAQRAAHAHVNVRFLPLDVLADPLPTDCDAVTCSLFLHHLSNEEAVALLARSGAAAGRRLVVSDLRRSRVNQWLTKLGCRLLTRSPVVHKDGPISIRAAFTMAEAAQLAANAGLVGARISPRFPARWLLEWSPP